MRMLRDVTPTPEQLKIVSRTRGGVEVIRGAAGSGKTTTALLKLNALTRLFLRRKARQEGAEPIRILVLTFNRTLRGYIEALALRQAEVSESVEIEISTFSKWARNEAGCPQIISDAQKNGKIASLSGEVKLPNDFLVKEVDYILGRFLPENTTDYLAARRDGRGISPRVERPLREAIVNDVISPYQSWKQENGLVDWNDLAIHLVRNKRKYPYDIVIADEVQDFSANQIRAIRNQIVENHVLVFVLDAAQRIYPTGFKWQETGISLRAENSYRLKCNYRNTIEIAKFASPLLAGIDVDEDATLPDFSSCREHGEVPKVIKGKFSGQVAYVIDYILDNVDLSEESVAILHPLGGGWFSYVKNAFSSSGLDCVDLTREPEWPDGAENIAFCTLHSAKGLEFDHVIIIGLNARVTPHGNDDGDDQLAMLRRLLAMGIGRARKGVVLGYKEEEASTLAQFLDPETYEEVVV